MSRPGDVGSVLNGLHLAVINDDVEPTSSLDIRPILHVVERGFESATKGAVCRAYGCAEAAVELGFCVPCHSHYEDTVTRNSFIYAVVCDLLADVAGETAPLGVSPMALAEFAVDALSDGDISLARPLLLGNHTWPPVKDSFSLDDEPFVHNNRALKVLHDV